MAAGATTARSWPCALPESRALRARQVPDGRKRPGPHRLDPPSGRAQRRCTLPDAQINLRQLAWSRDDRRLGEALQAEPAKAAQRADAPLLAALKGEPLHVPAAGGPGLGYAGDLCAAPGGGLVHSAQKARLGPHWLPDAPTRWTCIDALTKPRALQDHSRGDGQAVRMVAGRGVTRGQAGGARLLRWPKIPVRDHHAVLLA